MFKLYGTPHTRTARVLWTLEELNTPYEYISIGLFQGEGQSQEFLKLNPNGKVPVLVDDDLTLLETTPICTYIADQFPEAGIIPKPATAERAAYDQWCSFQLTELEIPAWMLTKNKLLYPENIRISGLEEPMTWEIKRAEKVLSKGLKGRDYILGNDFSVADIHIAFTLIWNRHEGFQINDDRIKDYLDRCIERPAFEKVRAMGQIF